MWVRKCQNVIKGVGEKSFVGLRAGPAVDPSKLRGVLPALCCSVTDLQKVRGHRVMGNLLRIILFDGRTRRKSPDGWLLERLLSTVLYTPSFVSFYSPLSARMQKLPTGIAQDTIGYDRIYKDTRWRTKGQGIQRTARDPQKTDPYEDQIGQFTKKNSKRHTYRHTHTHAYTYSTHVPGGLFYPSQRSHKRG